MLKSKNKDNWKGFAPRTAPLTRTRRLNAKGNSERAKRNARWHRELKTYLLDTLGINTCESCGTSYGLSIMHARKRRFITDRAGYFRAAVVCLPEHRSYDEATDEDVHQKMAEFVDKLIEAR